MKIRHKQTGEVEEVEPTMTVLGYGWCKAGPLDVDRYYPKAHWEPVQDEVWEDCTGEIAQSQVCILPIKDLASYRVRKVTLYERMDRLEDKSMCFSQPIYSPRTAFIVERKRPA